jgi:hypothetical protein
MTSVLETISKNKQGRPKGYQSRLLEAGVLIQQPDGGHRTKVNWVFMLDVLQLVTSSSKDIQQIVWGCTSDDLESGKKKFPPGWMTFAPEIGRYIANADDDEKQTVLHVIVDARERGLSWRDIGSHFRTLRLGEKSGNRAALISALCRTVNQFRQQFPKTPDSVVDEALQITLLAVRSKEETRDTSGN